ncbi:hypothetical protein M0R45_002320 [Rubus argutus]|uniref:SHSP domain-containing protein n=1 Tax=Rubus argutus TaxID=59490 RepID=A0AAW1VJX7_RUBAR
MSTTARIHPTASSLSSTIKHHLRPSPHSIVFRSNPNSLARRRTTKKTLTVATATPIEVCHKSSVTVPNKPGDCSFCQRVLLNLEEKHLPYDLKSVDLGNKPEWFLKINPQGKVPVVKLDVQWIGDSESVSKIFSTYIDPFSLDIWDPSIKAWSAARSELGGETAAVAKASIDWKETPEKHEFKADVPGLTKENVKVEVEKGKVLQIRGEGHVQKDENDNWHMMERSSGKFVRRFQLPENAKTEEVKATLENGVLTVTVPKLEVNRLIPIN